MPNAELLSALPGVLLFVGVAAGFDLFLAVIALSVVALAVGTGLPGATGDLGSWWLLCSVLPLYALEAAIERTSGLDQLWRWAGVIVRPVGAACLAVLLTHTPTLGASSGLAAGAAVVALVVHASRSGWAFLVRLEKDESSLRRGLLAEDVYVLAMALVWWRFPVLTAGLAAFPLLALPIRGRRYVSAFFVTWTLVRAGLVHLTRRSGWRTPARFPSWMKRQLAPSAVVTGGRLRATPAACLSRSLGPVRSGWLVVRGTQPRFVWPVRRKVQSLPLAAGRDTAAKHGPLCSYVRLQGPGAESVVLIVPFGGPGPRELVQELSRPPIE
jgi:hypothetical protein